jgi:putative ABC transport system substrate-binding protein
MITRRVFIRTLAGGLVAVPLAASAQQAVKVPRIGYLSHNLAANSHLPEAFRQGLRDLGYVEGRNVVIEYRSAEEGAQSTDNITPVLGLVPQT